MYGLLIHSAIFIRILIEEFVITEPQIFSSTTLSTPLNLNLSGGFGDKYYNPPTGESNLSPSLSELAFEARTLAD